MWEFRVSMRRIVRTQMTPKGSRTIESTKGETVTASNKLRAIELAESVLPGWEAVQVVVVEQ